MNKSPKLIHPVSDKKTILIIDDEPSLRNLLSRILTLDGYSVTAVETSSEGIAQVERQFYYVAVIDVILPDINGIELVKIIKEKSPDTEIIVMTAFATIRDGVEAMKSGAFDYIEKGKEEDELILKINRAFDKSELNHKVRELEKRIEKNSGFAAITGKSKAISDAIELAKKVAETDTTVLLLGETGTGKELFAKAIHNSGNRKSKPFIAINCSAIPKDLQESELFGYVKGAFTGAIKDKRGFFEEADGGSIFLDEIGDMSSETQSKLLRVLETNSFTKVGDTKNTNVNVRIISATNKDLKTEVEKGNFKNDLYYRLNAFEIYLPPLRERKDDIELLINYWIDAYCHKLGRKITPASDEFISKLKEYSFPGNIRELKNIIERAIIVSSGKELTSENLPEEINEQSNKNTLNSDSLKEIEKEHILKIYSQNNHNKALTAEKLGIGSVTLYRKLKEYGVE